MCVTLEGSHLTMDWEVGSSMFATTLTTGPSPSTHPCAGETGVLQRISAACSRTPVTSTTM